MDWIILERGMTSRKIEPIKKKDDIERIRSSLHSKPRDLLLFDLVTQSGVGMKYLLRLKVKDLLGLQVGDRINCGSMKANTVSEIIMSERLYRTWQNYLNAIEPAEDEFLLKSRKGNKPLNIASVSTMVRIWFRDAGLKGLSGTKSLQKTWERHFRSSDGVSPNSLQRANSEPAICPIEVETVKDKVYREISRAIMTGRLAPGERLLEAKIAGQMNVSRMPVREALHRLQEAGFVSPYQKTGKVVNHLSRQSLEEITHIRMILETEAARIAIQNSSQNTIAQMEHLYSKTVAAINKGNIDEMLELNKQFHFLFYQDAKMPILQQIITGLWDRVSPYVHILLKESDASASSRDVKKNHRGMLDGMRHKDPEEVCIWLEADLLEGKKMVYDLLDKWGVE